jgi:predicted permease
MRSTRGDVQRGLGEAGRSPTGALALQRLGRAIVAGQLAITLVLLVGASLLGRSLLRVLSVDPGFRTERILTMQLALPPVDSLGLPQAAQLDALTAKRIQFLDQVMTQVRAIPGVLDAGGTGSLPLTDSAPPDGVYLLINPGQAVPKSLEQLGQLFHDTSRTGDAEYSAVTAGFFRVLGIPLLRGRLFNAGDSAFSPHVALINQSLAREKWPNQDPIGRQIEFGGMDGDLRLLTVVGVVGDIHEDSLEQAAPPTIYVDIRQRPEQSRDFTVVIRTDADPAAVISAARRVVHDLDPNVPPQFGSMEEAVSESVQPRRFNLFVIAVFAATALLLAIAGVYGVMAYSVTRRTSEIGVRMALGATPANVLRLMLGQGFWTATVGVAIGLLVSVAAARAMATLLFGLSPTDPLTFAAAALLLALVAVLASYFPARRATKVDPMAALRYE